MYDGTESQPIPPGGGHIFDFDPGVAFRESSAPRLQSLGPPALAHPDATMNLATCNNSRYEQQGCPHSIYGVWLSGGYEAKELGAIRPRRQLYDLIQASLQHRLSLLQQLCVTYNISHSCFYYY